MNDELIAIPSYDEIKQAVFWMSSHKSPGHDGFLVIFYKHFWTDISPSIVKAVKEFFTCGFLLKAWNHTFVNSKN